MAGRSTWHDELINHVALNDNVSSLRRVQKVMMPPILAIHNISLDGVHTIAPLGAML